MRRRPPPTRRTTQYLDGGGISSTLDGSTGLATRFELTAEGWQAARYPDQTGAAGIVDYSRAMYWDYLPDSLLEGVRDLGGQRELYAYDADANQTLAVETRGATLASQSPLRIERGFDGFDQLSKTRSPAPETLGIDSYTKLVVHADGSDGSTAFTDSSSAGRALSASGNAQIDTAQSQFGGASALFDGSGDYLSAADSDDWAFGSGDFTIDLWVRFNSVASTGCLLAQYVAGGSMAWILERSSTGNLKFYWSTNGTSLSGSAPLLFPWSPSTGTWYHVALVRGGNQMRAFVNGSQIGTTQTFSDTIANATSNLTVGAYGTPGTYLNGWLDEVRVSKGVARWTSTFTPPTGPYSAGTSDGYTASSFAYDANGNTTQLIENRTEDAGGTQTAAGRTFTYAYDNLDRPLTQSDDYAPTASTSDDEQLAYTYTPTGLLDTRMLSKSNGAGGWTQEQKTTNSYFDDGELEQLSNYDGSNSVLEQHTLSYLDAGSAYVNGNRVGDVFKLKQTPTTPSAC